jgi:Sec-independent protein translocase protein TatA
MYGANGMPELVIVSVIALMVFGPAEFSASGKFLSETIRGLGKKIRDVGDCLSERSARPTPLNYVSKL